VCYAVLLVNVERVPVLLPLPVDVTGEALGIDVPFIETSREILSRDEVSGMSRLQRDFGSTGGASTNPVDRVPCPDEDGESRISLPLRLGD